LPVIASWVAELTIPEAAAVAAAALAPVALAIAPANGPVNIAPTATAKAVLKAAFVGLV
jgi:hypothetical protein